jgi:phage baseplate assembly protein W
MIMEEEKNSSFLGTGWSFPPRFRKETGSVVMLSDVEDINSSLHILLSTSIGERVMQPEYGCNLSDVLFEPVNLTLLTHMQNVVRDAIVYYEPRIKLLHLDLESNANEGRIDIRISYMVRGTNSRHNYVYPFYLKEGTEIRK